MSTESRKRRLEEEEDLDNTSSEEDDEDETSSSSSRKRPTLVKDITMMPSDLIRAAAVLQQTSLLVSQLERKYGTEVQQLADSAQEIRARLSSVAVKAWLARNFARQAIGGGSGGGGHFETDIAVASRTGGISRSDLRMMINAFLETLHLPVLSKRDETWTKRVLRECIGFTDADWRHGRRIAIRDIRSLFNFEETLKDLLALVHEEQRAAESLA